MMEVIPIECESPTTMDIDLNDTLYISDSCESSPLSNIRRFSNLRHLSSTSWNLSPELPLGFRLHHCFAIAVDKRNKFGDIYIAESSMDKIYRYNPCSNTLFHFAGTGIKGFSGDGGLAINANFFGPFGLAVSRNGSLFVADRRNNRVRRINLDGTVETVVGNGDGGYNGDNIPAISAALYHPTALCFDSKDSLYIAEFYNNRIRRVDVNGIITTVVGNSSEFYSKAHGVPSSCVSLNSPMSVVADVYDNLYIADSYNHRILYYNHITSIVTTVWSRGTSIPPTILASTRTNEQSRTNATFSAESLFALPCPSLSFPRSVALDSFGTLYILDNAYAADGFHRRATESVPSALSRILVINRQTPIALFHVMKFLSNHCANRHKEDETSMVKHRKDKECDMEVSMLHREHEGEDPNSCRNVSSCDDNRMDRINFVLHLCHRDLLSYCFFGEWSEH